MGGEGSGVSVYEMSLNSGSKKSASMRLPQRVRGYWSFLVATEVRESKLEDVGRTAIFVFEAMERLRSDIARHAKNGCIRSHGQEVFEGKTT